MRDREEEGEVRDEGGEIWCGVGERSGRRGQG